MYIIGLTGGIGSGKSTVSEYFKTKNIPVYCADYEAKMLMNSDISMKNRIKNIFGEDAYKENLLNSKHISSIVFQSKNKLQQLNEIVHPAVRAHFSEWHKSKSAPYIIKEAAILFESGSYKECNLIICVSAHLEKRIERIILRDQISEESARKRIQHQLDEKFKIQHSDFVIYNNDDLKHLEKQFLKLYEQLSKLCV